jgi:hypothetical protein
MLLLLLLALCHPTWHYRCSDPAQQQQQRQAGSSSSKPAQEQQQQQQQQQQVGLRWLPRSFRGFVKHTRQ